MKDKEDEARIKAYMAAKMAHIKMYNECMNLADGLDVEKFAELVRADEREACAKVCLDGADMPVQIDALKIIRAERERIANAIRARGNDLQTAIEKGTKAWADVPNASEWVEELRGNDTPEETPEVTTEVPCKTHPDAPHGFDRNASHSADRYVCECEGWEPVNNAYTKLDTTAGVLHKEWVGLTNEEIADVWKTEYFNISYELPRDIEARLKEKNA